jgi:hypothetical protein
MKKILLVLTLTLGTLVSNSQDEVIRNLKDFEKAGEGLYISKVIEIPNKTQKELQTQFKNWASTSFVNLREVMVSETDNQIVLNYITKTPNYLKMLGMKTPFNYDWYVRLVAQFKDGKVRIQFYDDGNVYRPIERGGAGGTNQFSATPARSTFIKSLIYIPKPESVKDLHKPSGIWYDISCDWEQNIDNMMLSFEKGMLDNTLTIKKDDF